MMKKISIYITTAAIALLPVLVPTPAYAQGLFGGNSQSKSTCGKTKTEFISCDSKTGLGTINDLVRISLIVLSIIIGAVAVGGIAYAGIIYASARDEQSKITEAKTLLRNIAIGLVLYSMTIAIIAWLLPGTVIEGSGATTDSSSSPSPTVAP